MPPKPAKRLHLLMLAGSGESREIAAALVGRDDVDLTVSHLRSSGDQPASGAKVRYGGFGGDEGFRSYLCQHNVNAVLDATHPFSVAMGRRVCNICQDLDLPNARVLRPPWVAQEGDRWREVADAKAASGLMRDGQRVFVTTGRGSLPALAAGNAACFLVRQMQSPTDVPDLNNVEYIVGKGPFSVDQEIEMLKRLRVDLLVVKNDGGEAGFSKLAAARALGLPVILIARPEQPNGPILASVEDALEWVASL